MLDVQLKLDVGENARIDFNMRIGDSRTKVTVHTGARLVNTEDASVGTVIDRNIIEQMPLNGRGIQTLIELTPGVVVVPVVDASRGQFAVKGQRADANYFTVDGVSANFDAGDPIDLANGQNFREEIVGRAGGISRDGRFLYLVQDAQTRRFLAKVEISTGGNQPLALGEVTRAVEAEDGYVYYSLRNNEIWRVPIDGGPPEKFLTDLLWLSSLAVGNRVYITLRSTSRLY